VLVIVCGCFSALNACSSNAPTTDIVITSDQFGTIVTVMIGSTISIPRPTSIENWQVDFSSPPLDLLNPPETRSAPGSSGWRFRATAAGECEIGLAPIIQGDASPRRFVVTIRVRS
jgi:hypothetical protein